MPVWVLRVDDGVVLELEWLACYMLWVLCRTPREHDRCRHIDVDVVTCCKITQALQDLDTDIRGLIRVSAMRQASAPGTSVAGVFTKSKTCSAPVDWCRSAVVEKSARALVVNSGNANAFTGKAGKETVKATAALAAWTSASVYGLSLFSSESRATCTCACSRACTGACTDACTQLGPGSTPQAAI